MPSAPARASLHGGPRVEEQRVVVRRARARPVEFIVHGVLNAEAGVEALPQGRVPIAPWQPRQIEDKAIAVRASSVKRGIGASGNSKIPRRKAVGVVVGVRSRRPETV